MSGRARLALCAAAEVALAGDRWARRTRASRREKRERLPGDDLVSESMWQATHATTIDATADELCHGWSTWGLGDVRPGRRHAQRDPAPRMTSPPGAAVDLYWLPLGAGGHVVRLNGRIYEALAARLHHRPRQDLYHSALEVRLGRERYVIEMAPVWNERAPDRGVVTEGAVASRLAGRLRIFRYEIRRWPNGRIPDAGEAVDSPRELTTDPVVARAILELVPHVPALVWGRDELGAGEMWNSNSVTSWLLARGGLELGGIRPPANGRAPGWEAGLAIARAGPATPDQSTTANASRSTPATGDQSRSGARRNPSRS